MPPASRLLDRAGPVKPAAAFLPLTADQQVDARALHEWLGIATRFNDWVAKIMDDYGFEEGTDFYSNLSKTGGRPRKDYLLTLDVAKEVAMIGNTPKGKATRRYFIAAEKAAAKMASGRRVKVYRVRTAQTQERPRTKRGPSVLSVWLRKRKPIGAPVSPLGASLAEFYKLNGWSQQPTRHS